MSLDKNRKIHIVDTTLRDGSHAVSHSYTVEQVTAIASGLDKVGVDIIELSHGDGLAGSSINYGFSATPEMELIRRPARWSGAPGWAFCCCQAWGPLRI